MGCGSSKQSDPCESSLYSVRDQYLSTRVNEPLKACNKDYERSMMLTYLSLYGG